MRLLLILALVIASVTFGPPAAAQPEHEMGQHHTQMAYSHHSQDGHRGSAGENTSHAVTHVCPGCALMGEPQVAGAEAPLVALPALPPNPHSLRSFHANPIPPPPRTA